MELQKQADNVYVDPELMEYAVRLVGATRRPADYNLHDIAPYMSFGASPRASINLILGARALALTRGRDYVVPPDIAELAPDVLRHRIVLSYEALADRVSADHIVQRVVEVVPRPYRPFTEDQRHWGANAAVASGAATPGGASGVSGAVEGWSKS
jgi:MoxR-like ATPase